MHRFFVLRTGFIRYQLLVRLGVMAPVMIERFRLYYKCGIVSKTVDRLRCCNSVLNFKT